jgi:hypothetical protein
VERVFARSELQPEGLIDRHPKHTQRDIERAEDERCPHRAHLAANADHQQDDARDHVQHVVPNIAHVERRLNAQCVEYQQHGAVQQEARPEHEHVQPCQAKRINQSPAAPNHVGG